MSTSGLAWTIGLLLGAGGVYGLYRIYTPNSMACPPLTQLDEMIFKIRTGETSEAVAEVMAKSYEANGCKAIAEALRLTIKAHQAYGPRQTGKATPGKGGVFELASPTGSKAGPDGTLGFAAPAPPLDATPIEDGDQFSVARIPDPSIRFLVQGLLAKAPCEWTDEDFGWAKQFDGDAHSDGSILHSFFEHGLFLPGAHSLAMVTAYNECRAQYLRAWECRAKTSSGSGLPSGSIGGSGSFSGSGSSSGSGSFGASGSGGFHT